MQTFYVIFLLVTSNINVFISGGYPENPIDATLPLFVSNFGYEIQFHEVTTEDGYILEIHRLLRIEDQKREIRKPVVLMMHGLIGSSADWLITGPNRSLAFILSDKGYDVWLGNNRGNTYSTKHVTKLETSYGYWDFSWHEMGIYDLPATIDYVLANTSQEKILLTCFSQGCTQTFVMGSRKPEYNGKIKFAVALSPAAYNTYLKGTLALFVPLVHIITKTLERVGYFAILSASPFLRVFTSFACRKGSAFQPLCLFVFFSFVGPGYEDVDQEHLVDYFQYIPAGTSIKQMLHYGFGKYYPGTFREYDYGLKRNLELYNSTTPPDYRLENVNFPIAIYHGLNDFIQPPEDINRLAKNLPNVVDKLLVTKKKLNHYDLLLGRNIRQLVYNRAIALIEKYTIS